MPPSATQPQALPKPFQIFSKSFLIPLPTAITFFTFTADFLLLLFFHPLFFPYFSVSVTAYRKHRPKSHRAASAQKPLFPPMLQRASML